jgi:hypothetical protein
MKFSPFKHSIPVLPMTKQTGIHSVTVWTYDIVKEKAQFDLF